MKRRGVALITGAATGMGFEVARKLCLDGWKVVAVDLDAARGEKALVQLGPHSAFVQANVSKYEDQLIAFQRAETLYGSIDFVFANAGILGKADFYDKVQQWPPRAPSLAVQDVCLTGVIYTCHLAMQFMRRNSPPGGVIIMTGSASSLYATPDLPLYASSKHGVLGLMRSMSVYLSNENIRVNCVLPGAIRTSLLPDETWSQFSKDNFTSVKEVVDAICGLLYDDDAIGRALEISTGEIFDRKQFEFCNNAMRKIMTKISY